MCKPAQYKGSTCKPPQYRAGSIIPQCKGSTYKLTQYRGSICKLAQYRDSTYKPTQYTGSICKPAQYRPGADQAPSPPAAADQATPPSKRPARLRAENRTRSLQYASRIPGLQSSRPCVGRLRAVLPAYSMRSFVFNTEPSIRSGRRPGSGGHGA